MVTSSNPELPTIPIRVTAPELVAPGITTLGIGLIQGLLSSSSPVFSQLLMIGQLNPEMTRRW
jgi:hypothetical protein